VAQVTITARKLCVKKGWEEEKRKAPLKYHPTAAVEKYNSKTHISPWISERYSRESSTSDRS
jgi:hypothetical protein